MKACADFAEAFGHNISWIMRGYTEGRVMFDCYIDDSLKTATRAKRTGGVDPVKFTIHDTININLVQLKTLLSYLGKALLQMFAKRDKCMVIVYGTSTFGNKPNLFEREISDHSHEEADTLIPPHVLDAASKNERNVDV